MQKSIVIFFISVTLFGLEQFSKTQKEKYLYPLGEKLYKKKCQGIDSKKFATIESLHHYIESKCDLKERRYNIALSYYLWDGMKKGKDRVVFSYSQHDRCAICGMLVYKYPKWIAMAVTKNGKNLYFDGVKDMLRYYFSTSNSGIVKFYAQDYYSKRVFDLKRGFLVVGSDIYGPMGEELIPFENLEDAQSFLQEHNGVRILRFDQISRKLLKAFDE